MPYGFAALLALSLGSSAAAGISPVVGSDVECFLLSNLFAKSATQPEARKAAVFARFYYLGIVKSEISAHDLLTAVPLAAKSINRATAGDAMKACVQSMQTVDASIAATLRQGQPPPRK